MRRAPTFTHRLARSWLRLYTSGLAQSIAHEQRAEIENDMAEHARERESAGWSPRQIARERLSRTLRGMTSDVLWRREVLLTQQGKAAPVGFVSGAGRWLRTCWHTLAAVELAVFFVAVLFRAHGFKVLGDNLFLGGMEPYGPREQIELMIVTVIVAGLTVTLLAGAFARAVSLSVKGSNVAMIVGTFPAMGWHWMVTPFLLMALIVLGAVVDLGRQETRPTAAEPEAPDLSLGRST